MRPLQPGGIGWAGSYIAPPKGSIFFSDPASLGAYRLGKEGVQSVGEGGGAAQKLAHERPGQTLQPTALVHEAYLRLVGDGEEDEPNWNGKGHFFGAAAEAMRRILVENSRRKGSQKRGGGYKRVPLHDAESMAEAEPEAFIALDEALVKLTELDELNANLVKLHFFAGLQFKEAAALLDISERTAKRRWAFARSWLQLEMKKALSAGKES